MANYVKKMLDAFKKIQSTMTLKMHFLNNHFEDFLKQSPKESDEHGERFHQITMPMEKRFKGKRLDAMLGEVCWWSQKIALHKEGEDDEDDGDDEDGSSSDSESENREESDDGQPRLKKFKKNPLMKID